MRDIGRFFVLILKEKLGQQQFNYFFGEINYSPWMVRKESEVKLLQNYATMVAIVVGPFTHLDE